MKQIKIKESSIENTGNSTREPVKPVIPVQIPKRIEIVEVDGDLETPGNLETDENFANTETSDKSSLEETCSSIQKPSSGDMFRSKSTGLCRRVEKELNDPTSGTETDSVPPVPKASAQFYRDWRSLKSAHLKL